MSLSESEIETFGQAWGWFLGNSATTWVYSCDSGNFGEVCERSVAVHGPWMTIYQPCATMMEGDLDATLLIRRTDRKRITRPMLRQLEPIKTHVETLYLDSFRDIVAHTDSKWTTPCDGTLKSVAQFSAPIKIEGGIIKQRFKIRGPTETQCCGNSWYPGRLMAWLGEENVDWWTKTNFNQDQIEKYTVPISSMD